MTAHLKGLVLFYLRGKKPVCCKVITAWITEGWKSLAVRTRSQTLGWFRFGQKCIGMLKKIFGDPLSPFLVPPGTCGNVQNTQRTGVFLKFRQLFGDRHHLDNCLVNGYTCFRTLFFEPRIHHPMSRPNVTPSIHLFINLFIYVSISLSSHLSIYVSNSKYLYIFIYICLTPSISVFPKRVEEEVRLNCCTQKVYCVGVWYKQYKGENRRWLSQSTKSGHMGVGGVRARQDFADRLMTGWAISW